MAKYSLAFKKEVVEVCLQGAGCKAVAARFGLEQAQVRYWVGLYQQHGEASLSPRQSTHYSAEYKVNVLQHMWCEERSYYQTATLYGLSDRSSVREWERLYHTGGIHALENPIPEDVSAPCPLNHRPLLPPLEYPAKRRVKNCSRKMSACARRWLT